MRKDIDASTGSWLAQTLQMKKTELQEYETHTRRFIMKGQRLHTRVTFRNRKVKDPRLNGRDLHDSTLSLCVCVSVCEGAPRIERKVKRLTWNIQSPRSGRG